MNPDGYSIPIDFFKYNPDFRRGIREFQEDLAAGRLEPEWQAAAAEAMEERARGDFDAYKENQYEEFWGQKQKIDWSIPAGESTTLKLDMMIKNGVFRAGDEIVFTRAIGRKEKRVLLEKECKVNRAKSPIRCNLADTIQVVGVGVRSMTLAIPLGRFKYPCQQTALEASTLPEPQVQGGEDTEDRSGTTAPNAYPQEIRPLASNDARVDQIAANEPEGNTDLEKLGPDADQAPTRKEFNDETLVVCSNGVSNSPKKETLKTPSKNTILYEINNLKQLMDKIIEIDGRLNPKDLKEVPAISPWKCMRVRRDNQDLGTLFEMRDDFYAYKLPHITKASKK